MASAATTPTSPPVGWSTTSEAPTGLVGWSSGAYLVLAVAAAQPDAVEAVAQVLASDTASTAARLVHQWPRARRRMRFGR